MLKAARLCSIHFAKSSRLEFSPDCCPIELGLRENADNFQELNCARLTDGPKDFTPNWGDACRLSAAAQRPALKNQKAPSLSGRGLKITLH
jgi:hypothetical protein